MYTGEILLNNKFKPVYCEVDFWGVAETFKRAGCLLNVHNTMSSTPRALVIYRIYEKAAIFSAALSEAL